MTEICVFPGQGSHRIGMGAALFEAYPHLLAQADDIVGYPIAELCLRGPEGRLADTRYAQCAIYVVDALSYVDRVRSTGRVPDYVAGHSLGEYVALFASGAYDFVTGVEIVAARAATMAEAGPGAMCAVIGLDGDRLLELSDGELQVDIANLNSPDQIVISGTIDDIAAARRRLEPHATAVIPLRVSGAFHSRHMATAAAEFARFLRSYRFAELRIPVVSNVTARPYAGAVADLLVQQLTSPVRWTQTVEFLLDLPDPEFHEVGPAQVLSGLISQIRENRPGNVGIPALRSPWSLRYVDRTHDPDPGQSRRRDLLRPGKRRLQPLARGRGLCATHPVR